MKQQRLGTSDLVVGRIAYGNMRAPGAWNPAAVTKEKRDAGILAHHVAFDAGYTLFDTADIYGQGMSEQLLGEALRMRPGMREKIVIATKCGIRWADDPMPGAPHRFDFSKEHILWSCEQSLKRMGIETIDLYQLHRPDMLMEPAEIAEAFDRLHREGKVRYFGVSNFFPSMVSMLKAFLNQKIVVNQIEIHLGRLDPLVNGTSDQCIELSITPLAWSPLGGGWLGSGRVLGMGEPNYPHKKLVQSTLDEIAAELGISRSATALAWLMRHPSGIIPIVGSNSPANLRDAVTADSVEMSREQWYRLLLAARGRDLP